MRHSTAWHRLGMLGLALVLAGGLLAATGVGQRVEADQVITGTCTGVQYPYAKMEFNYGVYYVEWGLTGRVCTDGTNLWNYSSSYPTHCWVSYPSDLDATGVCGYGNNFTHYFYYQDRVTFYNYTAGTLLAAILAAVTDWDFYVPAGYKFTCWVSWDYTPYDVYHGITPAGSWSCTSPTLIL